MSASKPNDRVGNRTRQTEGTQQRTFTYNANNQALSVGRSNQASVAGYVNEAGTVSPSSEFSRPFLMQNKAI